MTSSAAPERERACFVFVYLPGQVTPVVSGRLVQRWAEAGVPVGRFVYGRSYLANPKAVPLDLIALPLRPGSFPEVTALGGVPGVIRDAAPDDWGRRVIERARGVRTTLPEIDYLLSAGDDRVGALAFGTGPDAPAPSTALHRAVRLPELLAAAELVERDQASTEETQRAAILLAPGVSMGGARPKAAVRDAGAIWIAKFPAREDRWNVAAVEAGLLTLAGRCGIQVPPHRVTVIERRPVLLVQRFDRELTPSGSYARARFASALTVLGADELPSPRWSYLLLAQELRRWSADLQADREELFRRMVFNALVSNGDDHPRNHALIAPGAEFRLSPLFDVVPMPRRGSVERDLAMVAGEFGRRATRANLVSAPGQFGLSELEAGAIVDQLDVIVSAYWEADLQAHGASAADLEAVRPAICPEGFDYPAP